MPPLDEMLALDLKVMPANYPLDATELNSPASIENREISRCSNTLQADGAEQSG